jgi:Uma2 family endonuclease
MFQYIQPASWSDDMSAAPKWNLISIEEYLEGELVSPIKHEYLGGVVYAMAGARNLHNIIKDNAQGSLHFRLRGKRCRAFGSDTKVHIELPRQTRFYYPDVGVVCEPNSPMDSFHDRPVVIFEVLSRSTRRIDEGEKKDAYLTIPSLRVYALVEQETAAVVVFRRGPDGFVREIYDGLAAVLPLLEIEIELPLAEIYDSVEFSPESSDEDE